MPTGAQDDILPHNYHFEERLDGATAGILDKIKWRERSPATISKPALIIKRVEGSGVETEMSSTASMPGSSRPKNLSRVVDDVASKSETEYWK